jgi:glycosyltransferase involved in cell wall biosynthesis
MKVAIISRHTLCPPRSGGALRVAQNARALATLAEVSVFAANLDDPFDAGAIGRRDPLPGPVQYHEARRSQPFSRLDRYRSDLMPGGERSADEFLVPEVLAELDAFLDAARPDLIVFEEYTMGQVARHVRRRGIPSVYDAHNFEAGLAARLEGQKRGRRDRLYGRLMARQVRNLEGWLARHAAQVWACSDADAAALRSAYGIEGEVAIVPNGVDTVHYARPDGAPRGAHFLFVGSYRYPPNQAAALELCDDVLPRLRRELPKAELHLVGRGIEGTDLADRHDPAGGLNVIGGVEDVREAYWGARALLVPLREGSGTRLKILEAMAAGLPVVSTRLGAEGLDLVHEETVLFAETPEAFVDAALRLANDDALHGWLGAAARAHVERAFSQAACATQIGTALRRLNLSASRQAR